MQLSKNTSSRSIKGLIIKTALILIIVIGSVSLLSKIDFPSPSKEIKKIISHDKLKIVK
tara:strand:+ start:38 stop:214 length:177 start_codon:yes stop_codon:yes gene_type:complete